MITVTFTTGEGGQELRLPWEGPLPAVGDTLFDLKVKGPAAPSGAELSGFNHAVPKWIVHSIRGTVSARCWTGPGEVTLLYDPEGE